MKFKNYFLALLLVLVVIVTANPVEAHARKHHHSHARHHVHHSRTVAGNIGGHSVRFVRGRLICAINVSNWLRAHGFRSPDSRSSKAFLKYAHVAAANVRFGDVHFNYRKGGGHVMVALGGGRCLNPSSRAQGWVVKTCPAGGTWVRT